MKSWEKYSLLSLYKACRLCPRECAVDRLSGQRGFCGERASLRIAAIEAHFGEEPFFTGWNGSGTVFFSGCSLRCRYCQNYQISRMGIGEILSISEVAVRISRLQRLEGIHNVNLVTPDHFIPHSVCLLGELQDKGQCLPIIFNVSGYQKVDTLRLVEPYVDIYLPDFKYGDSRLAAGLSRAEDYPSRALEAIEEMLKQKGFLDAWESAMGFSNDSPAGLAKKGVIVRHLVLPGQVSNSLDALSMLFLEFGPDLPLSLMSQYVPVGNFLPEGLDRMVWPEEFQMVLDHALELGFNKILYQPVSKSTTAHCETPFLPDFRKKRPFSGNLQARLAEKHGASPGRVAAQADTAGNGSWLQNYQDSPSLTMPSGKFRPQHNKRPWLLKRWAQALNTNQEREDRTNAD